jgi:hypothetical protein
VVYNPKPWIVSSTPGALGAYKTVLKALADEEEKDKFNPE